MEIRSSETREKEPVAKRPVAAWAPAFHPIRQTLPDNLFRRFYGGGWRAAQRTAVIKACTDSDNGLQSWRRMARSPGPP